MDTLAADLRYALRSLRHTPVFTAVVVVTLALGIGANATIFSVVDATLLRPLPFREPERLLQFYLTIPRAEPARVDSFYWSYPKFETLRARHRSFTHVAALSGGSVNLTGGEINNRTLMEMSLGGATLQ